MKLAISNIGPLERAEIEIGAGITLIGALNEGGKSTLLNTAAGLLTGAPFFAGITTKKESEALVRAGAKTGRAAITSDAGEVVAAYPGGELTSTGQPPHAGPNSVGRAPFLALAPKERAKVLSRILKSEPSADDLAAVLRTDGFEQEDIDEVLQILADKGWDGGHTFVSEEWTKKKGAWEQVTHERYGSAKAGAWRPAEWTDELGTVAIEDLEAAVATATAELEQARAGKAVDDAEVQRLEALAGELRDRKAIADEKAVAAQGKHNELEAKKAERAALPSGEADAGEPCPHCSQHVVARPKHPGPGYTLHKADPVDGAELKRRREELAGLDGAISRLSGEHATANRELLAAQAAVKESEDAAAALAKHKGKKKGDPAATAEAIKKADEALARAQLRFNARQLKDQADAKHARIAGLEKVRAHFAPDGLRQSKLAETLTAFCDGVLRELAEAAGWKPIVIRPDMSLLSGGLPILSRSAEWRAEALLAVAFAKLGNSPLVILDEADINDRDHREGLVELLDHAGLPALVGMTLNQRDALPPLEEAGIGRCYWIERGVAQRIEPAKKAAA